MIIHLTNEAISDSDASQASIFKEHRAAQVPAWLPSCISSRLGQLQTCILGPSARLNGAEVLSQQELAKWSRDRSRTEWNQQGDVTNCLIMLDGSTTAD